MSNGLIKSRLFDAAVNDTDLVPETLFGFAKFVVQMGDALAAKILQFHPLQVVPDSLSWVQLRRIAGELLQMNPLGRPSAQVILHHSAAVDGGTIPQHQQLPSNMPTQVLEEPDYILSSVGPLLYHQVQLASQGDASHGRQVVSAQGGPDDGSLTHRSVGAHLARQQVEPRLVRKDHRPSFFYRLFLIWGQRSSFQRWMAASLRWLARCIGFWLLQPQAFKMRPTWSG